MPFELFARGKQVRILTILAAVKPTDYEPIGWMNLRDAFAIEKRGTAQTVDVRLRDIRSLPEMVEHLDLSMRGSQMPLEGTRDLLHRPVPTSGHEQQ